MPPKNFPIYFVSNRVAPRVLGYGLIIPLTFIVFTKLDASFLPISLADSLAQRLGLFWPILPENYELMKTIGRLKDANNYVLFFCAIIVFGIFCVGYAIYQYFNERKPIKFPSFGDGWVILIGTFIYFALSRIDRVTLELTSLTDFYLDRHGIYFLKEYAIVAACLFALMVLTISIARMVHTPRKAAG